MILNIGQTLTAFQWPTDASANPFKPPETISVIFIMKVRSNFPWGGAVPSGTVHQRWPHTNYTNQICLDQGLHQWQILINAVQLECCTWLTIYLEYDPKVKNDKNKALLRLATRMNLTQNLLNYKVKHYDWLRQVMMSI